MTETEQTWPEAESARYRAAGHWQGLTFGARLRQSAAAHGERVALVDGDRRWTYADLDAEADRVAHGLRSHGVGRGDRVVCPSSPTGPSSYSSGSACSGSAPSRCMPCPATGGARSVTWCVCRVRWPVWCPTGTQGSTTGS